MNEQVSASLGEVSAGLHPNLGWGLCHGCVSNWVPANRESQLGVWGAGSGHGMGVSTAPRGPGVFQALNNPSPPPAPGLSCPQPGNPAPGQACCRHNRGGEGSEISSGHESWAQCGTWDGVAPALLWFV